jgi:hypothetical protein
MESNEIYLAHEDCNSPTNSLMPMPGFATPRALRLPPIEAALAAYAWNLEPT